MSSGSSPSGQRFRFILFAVCSFGFGLLHLVLRMPPRRLLPPAEQIANILRDLDWVHRHLRYGWLRRGNHQLAALVAAVMSPDVLLAGTSTGAKPERVIPLNAVPSPPVVVRRAVRRRLS